MKLSLNNFKQYKDYVLDLPDTGMVLLKGETGKGKTSLFEGIYDAITGDADDVNPWTGEKPTSALLLLPTFEMSVERTRLPGALTVTTAAGMFHDDAAQAEIYRILGMSAQEFVAAGYIRQRMAGSLLSLPPADQLRFIQKLAFGDQDPETYKKRVVGQIEQRASHLRRIEGVLTVHSEAVERLKRKLDSLNADAGAGPTMPEGFEDMAGLVKDIEYTEKFKQDLVRNIQQNNKLLQHGVHGARKAMSIKRESFDAQNLVVEREKALLEAQHRELGAPWSEMTQEDVDAKLALCREKEKYHEWKEAVTDLTADVKESYPDIDRPVVAFLEAKLDAMAAEREILNDRATKFCAEIAVLRAATKNHRCPECNASLKLDDGQLVLACEARDRDTLESEIESIQTQNKEISKRLTQMSGDSIGINAVLSLARALKAKAMKDPMPEITDAAALGAEATRLQTYKSAQLQRKAVRDGLIREKDRLDVDLGRLWADFKRAEAAVDAGADITDETELRKRADHYAWELSAQETLLAMMRDKIDTFQRYQVAKATFDQKRVEIAQTETELQAAELALSLDKAALDIVKIKWAASGRLKELSDVAAVGATESIVAAINEHAKQYIDRMFPHGGTNVRILSGFKTKKGDDRAKLALEVTHRGQLVGKSIKPLSGGEQDRITLAFQLAMADLYNAPFIMIDEGFAGVDVENTMGICLDVLKEASQTRLIVMAQHGAPEGIFDQVISV